MTRSYLFFFMPKLARYEPPTTRYEPPTTRYEPPTTRYEPPTLWVKKVLEESAYEWNAPKKLVQSL
jgi:hypothetical protein